jgi:hypothetical protein
MERYLQAAGLEGRSDKTPLFRTATKKKKKRELIDRGLNGNNLLRIVKRRLKGVGLPEGAFCCHSFRATTATNLLRQKVAREQVRTCWGTRMPGPPISITAPRRKWRGTSSSGSRSERGNAASGPWRKVCPVIPRNTPGRSAGVP